MAQLLYKRLLVNSRIPKIDNNIISWRIYDDSVVIMSALDPQRSVIILEGISTIIWTHINNERTTESLEHILKAKYQFSEAKAKDEVGYIIRKLISMDLIYFD